MSRGAFWVRSRSASFPTARCGCGRHRRLNEFTGDRTRAVFEALAPVLVTGRTRFIGYQPRLVDKADAADYQSPDKTPPRPARLPPPGQESTLGGMDAAL